MSTYSAFTLFIKCLIGEVLRCSKDPKFPDHGWQMPKCISVPRPQRFRISVHNNNSAVLVHKQQLYSTDITLYWDKSLLLSD